MGANNKLECQFSLKNIFYDKGHGKKIMEEFNWKASLFIYLLIL